MELCYATTNKGKFLSMKRCTDPYGISLIQKSIAIYEPRSSDVEDVAITKAARAWKKIGKPCIVLDAGFYVNALNGFPKTFVNFALETIGIGGILKLVEGKERGAEFRECLAYYDLFSERKTDPFKTDPLKVFISSVRGILSPDLRGTKQKHIWSDLAFIFIPEGKDKTLAEMTYEEYLEWCSEKEEEGQSAAQLFVDWFVKEHNLSKIPATS